MILAGAPWTLPSISQPGPEERRALRLGCFHRLKFSKSSAPQHFLQSGASHDGHTAHFHWAPDHSGRILKTIRSRLAFPKALVRMWLNFRSECGHVRSLSRVPWLTSSYSHPIPGAASTIKRRYATIEALNTAGTRGWLGLLEKVPYSLLYFPWKIAQLCDNLLNFFARKRINIDAYLGCLFH